MTAFADGPKIHVIPTEAHAYSVCEFESGLALTAEARGFLPKREVDIEYDRGRCRWDHPGLSI